MANQTGGLFETLVAAVDIASAAPTFRNTMLDKVYTEYTGVKGFGQTLQINIPTVNEGDVVDIGSGPIQPTDTAHNTVNLVLNNNKSVSFIIRTFDQVRTPQDLVKMYVGAKIQALKRKVNRQIVNLANSTAFPNYTVITSTAGTAGRFSRADIAAAWANIVGAGAPINLSDMFLVTNQVPYGNMIADTTLGFTQQYVVGEAAAVAAQQHAMIAPQFSTQIDFDQQFGQVGSAYTALYFHRYAIAMGTAHVPLGSQMPSLGDGIALSGKAEFVEEGYTFLDAAGNLPCRVQMWQDPVQQGWVVHVHCVYSLNVVRPEFGSYMVTT